MTADADIAAIAGLLGEPARAAMLDAMLDGEDHAAGELARRAGIAPSTTSEHLSRLLAGGLVVVEPKGRQRRYRLASRAVGEALEAVARIAPAKPVRSLRDAGRGDALRACRTCYDHLAGRVGVAVTEAFVARDALVLGDGSFAVTARGERLLTSLGVDVDAARGQRRSFARECLDWTERRPHLAGALGAAVAQAFFERQWLQRRPNDRALTITPAGVSALRDEFAIDVS